MPRDIAPMAMTLADEPFNHPDWLYEVKWDGYRAIAFCRGKDVDLRSRKSNNFNKRFSEIRNAFQKLNLNAGFGLTNSPCRTTFVVRPL